MAPITAPALTTWPFFTPTTETQEYDVRTPPAWSIEMNSDPATVPANETVPSAGARIGVPAQPGELVGLDSLSEDGRQGAREHRVLVTLRARDGQTDAVFPLAYRVRLVRGDRWYVAAVNTTQEG